LKIIFVLTNLYIVLNCSELLCQVNEDWTSIYNSSGTYESGISVKTDNSGNVYTAGTIQTSTGFDCILIKYNNYGNEIWTSIYDNPLSNLNDGVTSMVLDGRGNIFITGTTFSFENDVDYLTIKYDSSGDMKWVRTFGDTIIWGNDTTTFLSDYTEDIEVDNFGNVYVTGDDGTIKYDSLGNLLWIVKDDITIQDMTIDVNSNIYITGFRYDQNTHRDCRTIKYNSLGVRIWISDYMGPTYSDDQGLAVTADDLGNVYVTGFTHSNNYSDYSKYLTLKYDESGIQQWAAIYGEQYERNIANDIEVDKSGNVYVTGNAFSSNLTSNDCYGTIKYSPSGLQLWLTLHTGSSTARARDLELDNQGNIYVTGYFGSSIGDDYSTVKYNSNGLKIWQVRFNGSFISSEELRSIAIDNVGNVYVTGDAFPNLNMDIATAKFSQTITGISEGQGLLLSSFSLSQNYPNPFNPMTVIRYSIPSNFRGQVSYVKLVIFNTLGMEIATLVNEIQNTGEYEVEFDGSSLTSGVYFYRIEVDSRVIDTRRMVLLK